MLRPDMRTALDVRSYESIVVVPKDEPSGYPEGCTIMARHSEIKAKVDDCSVVVFDRVDVSRRALADVFRRRPRLTAVVTQGIEHEKQVRRTLAALHPFAEVWTVSMDLGKALVTDARGEPYDRDQVIDARPEALA